jgi:hypothetical protein
VEAWEERGGVGAWSGFRIYGSTPEHPLGAKDPSAATACLRVGIYEILNDGNAWQQIIIDFSFLFSTIDMTWTVSRMVFVVTYTQTVRYSAWTLRSTVVFSCRLGVSCSLDLLTSPR